MRNRKAVAVWAVCVLFLIGCERVTPVEKANEEQILLKGNGAEPADLDPHIATGIPESRIIISLLEGLMRPNPVDLTPEPGMAERHEISDDGKTYTFYLREDAYWSNGDPVRAQDFAFAYERILTPAFGGAYAYMLYTLENAEAFNQGEVKDFSEVGVKVINDKTLELRLKAPTPYFLSVLLHYSWFPVHPATILKHGPMEKRGTRWTRPGNFVGNGPFILKKWKVHDVIVVEKSPTYYAPEEVLLNAVHFYPIDDLNTEERNFRAGQIHVTESLPINKILTYEEENPDLLHVGPQLGTYYYMFNLKVPPLDKVEVRKALAMSIDRESLAVNVLKRSRIPAYHFTPPNTAGYTSRARVEENIEQARALLAQAGFPGGEGFPTLELLYNTSESHRILAEAIQEMWKTNLGIDIRLVNQDWKVYLVSRRNEEFQIIRAGWIGDYNDPSTFLDLLFSGSGNNKTGWKNEAYDAAIKEASLVSDPEARMEIFQTAEQILMDELPIMPIYFYKTNYLVHPAVQGWYPNILDNHPYQGMFLEN